MSEIRAGDRVRSHVYVDGKRIPMHVGIVVRDCGDGTYDVDRMSLHGGAPWVVRESGFELALEAASTHSDKVV